MSSFLLYLRAKSSTQPIFDRNLTNIQTTVNTRIRPRWRQKHNDRHSEDAWSILNQELTDNSPIYWSTVDRFSFDYQPIKGRLLADNRPSIYRYISKATSIEILMGTNHSNHDLLKSKSIQTFPERTLKASTKEKEPTLLLSCRALALAMKLSTEKERWFAVDVYSRMFLSQFAISLSLCFPYECIDLGKIVLGK